MVIDLYRCIGNWGYGFCNVLWEWFIHWQRNALCLQDTHTGFKIKRYSPTGLKIWRRPNRAVTQITISLNVALSIWDVLVELPRNAVSRLANGFLLIVSLNLCISRSGVGRSNLRACSRSKLRRLSREECWKRKHIASCLLRVPPWVVDGRLNVERLLQVKVLL